MTDTERQRLADGIAAVVRVCMAGGDLMTVFMDAHDAPPLSPPLSPHQLVCLHGLVGLPVPTAAVVDALREAGLIEVENERLVRAGERGRCAKLCEEYADERRAAYKTGRGPDRANPHTDGEADAAYHLLGLIRGATP